MKNTEEVIIEPLQVKVINDNVDEAIRRFRMMVQKDGILNQYRIRQAYEKPSQKKKRKKREALQRKLFAENHEKLVLSGEWEKIQKRREQKKLKKQEFSQNKTNKKYDF